MPLQGERAPRPKKTQSRPQSRPINPKQPGITQGFPALFSQLAFFKASFWETPCRGRGSLYISTGLDGAPVSFHFSSSGLARGQAPRRPPKKKTQSRPKADQSTQSSLESPKAFRLYSLNLPSLRLPSGKPLAGDGAPYILARGWMVHPFLFIFPLRGLPGARPQEDLQRRRPKADPKQTQSRPINPKQPGITQGFPALFSQLAFFKASFWETPCRGRGSLYISAGLDGAPVSFHFSSSGLARGQAPRRPPKKKTQSRPKADQSTQSGLESPKAFRLYSLNLPSLRLPSGKPLAGDGAPYILARGWMVHPFLFIFPLRGLPGARPQEDLQRRRPKADPKQTNQPKAAWNHPRLSGSILSTCLL